VKGVEQRQATLVRHARLRRHSQHPVEVVHRVVPPFGQVKQVARILDAEQRLGLRLREVYGG
jgi:hypothetical protein